MWKRSTSAQLPPEPLFTEKSHHVIKLSKAFNKTKLLDASVDSEEEFSQLTYFEAHTKGMRILPTPNKRKYGTKKVSAGGDQAVSVVTLPGSRKPVATTKAGTSSVQGTDIAIGIALHDPTLVVKDPLQNQAQTSPPSIYKRGNSPSGTIMTKSQTTGTQKGKRPTEMASTKLGSRPPPKQERVALPNSESAVEASLSPDALCKPKTHIVFLKVHKSASSTVMNILFRFGETHNLTFALPINGASQLYYPHYFTAGIVEGFSPNKESQFNIMCHHMRFFQPEVRAGTLVCSSYGAEPSLFSRTDSFRVYSCVDLWKGLRGKWQVRNAGNGKRWGESLIVTALSYRLCLRFLDLGIS